MVHGTKSARQVPGGTPQDTPSMRTKHARMSAWGLLNFGICCHHFFSGPLLMLYHSVPVDVPSPPPPLRQVKPSIIRVYKHPGHPSCSHSARVLERNSCLSISISLASPLVPDLFPPESCPSPTAIPPPRRRNRQPRSCAHCYKYSIPQEANCRTNSRPRLVCRSNPYNFWPPKGYPTTIHLQATLSTSHRPPCGLEPGSLTPFA